MQLLYLDVGVQRGHIDPWRTFICEYTGALVYRPQDKNADKRIAEDNSVKTDEKMAEYNSVESHSPMKKSIKMVVNPILVAYYLNTILWNASLVLLRAFLYSYITEVYFSTFWAGTALTLFGVGVLVMSVAMPVINSKVETNKYLVHLVSAIAMKCSACGMGLIHNVYAIIALTCVYGGMFGVLLSNIPRFVKHLNGTRAHNLVYAVSQTCGGIGALIAPPILPLIQQSLPQNSMFFFSALFSSLSFTIMLILLVIKRDKVWRPYTKPREFKHIHSEELPDVNDSDSISHKGDLDMAHGDYIENLKI